MSETGYSFQLQPSRLGQRWFWASTLFLALVIATWPQYFTLQPLIQLLLILWLLKFRLRHLPVPLAPFTLTNEGRGRLLGTGEVFHLSSRCRLLPQVILLHSDALGWYWLWRDSTDDSGWRRLCRIALKAQRGKSMVGLGSELNSG